MALRQYRYTIIMAACAALTAGAAVAQPSSDPIGPLSKTATFDRAQKVEVGRTAAGKIACYFTEQGDSHRLDIGITADGAFIRLETADPRDMTPQPPVRVFAGKRIERGGYATNEFTVLDEYQKNADFYMPTPDRGDFVLVAKYDAAGFLEMVAHARGEFVVAQSMADPKSLDYVAIYHFDMKTIPALLSCMRERIHAAAAPQAPAAAAPAPSAAEPTPPPQGSTAGQEIVKFFDNGNVYAVHNRPRRTTVFTLAAPMRVTRIMTYHWNNGNGAPAGRIALRSRAGETYGPWQASGEPGQGGVPSAYWVVEPDVPLPAGTYTIVDSNPSTWAQNAASRHTGMATVEGYRE